MKQIIKKAAKYESKKSLDGAMKIFSNDRVVVGEFINVFIFEVD